MANPLRLLDSGCLGHLEFTGSFYSLLLCFSATYTKSAIFSALFETLTSLFRCDGFTLTSSHWTATREWHAIEMIIALHKVPVGCKAVSNFFSLTFLRVPTAWILKVEVLLLLLLLFPFSLLCFKRALFSKAFDIFIVIILMCIKKVVWFNMLQMTKNATLCPYSLSAYERLRKIVHSAEWFQRYNIILHDMITMVFFFCFFEGGCCLLFYSDTASHLHWISGLQWTCSRFLVYVTLLVSWAETWIMNAFIVKMWIVGTWQKQHHVHFH